jgi:hypothetical protein
MTSTQETKYYEFSKWVLENGCDMSLIMPEEDKVFIMQENDSSNDWVQIPVAYEEVALMA